MSLPSAADVKSWLVMFGFQLSNIIPGFPRHSLYFVEPPYELQATQHCENGQVRNRCGATGEIRAPPITRECHLYHFIPVCLALSSIPAFSGAHSHDQVSKKKTKKTLCAPENSIISPFIEFFASYLNEKTLEEDKSKLPGRGALCEASECWLRGVYVLMVSRYLFLSVLQYMKHIQRIEMVFIKGPLCHSKHLA